MRKTKGVRGGSRHEHSACSTNVSFHNSPSKTRKQIRLLSALRLSPHKPLCLCDHLFPRYDSLGVLLLFNLLAMFFTTQMFDDEQMIKFPTRSELGVSERAVGEIPMSIERHPLLDNMLVTEKLVAPLSSPRSFLPLSLRTCHWGRRPREWHRRWRWRRRWRS